MILLLAVTLGLPLRPEQAIAAHLAMGEVDAAATADGHVREAWLPDPGHVPGEVTCLVTQIQQHHTPAAADFPDQARELLAARGPALRPGAS